MAITVLLHASILNKWSVNNPDQPFLENLEAHNNFHVLENLIRRARQWFVEHDYHKSIAKLTDELYRFRASIDNASQRILFRPMMDNGEFQGLFIMSQVSRENTFYSKSQYHRCIPAKFNKHTLSIDDLKNHPEITVYVYEKIKAVPDQYQFYKNIISSDRKKSAYNITYAPPGAGKTHLIQEMILRLFEDTGDSGEDFDRSQNMPEHTITQMGCNIQNNIVLVPSDKLLIQYVNHLKHQCFDGDIPPEATAEQLDDIFMGMEHSYVLGWDYAWSFHLKKLIIQHFLYEETLYHRSLIIPYSEFFEVLADKQQVLSYSEIAQCMQNYKNETIGEDIINQIIPCWPSIPNVISIVSNLQVNEKKDSILKMLNQKKSAIEKILTTVKKNHPDVRSSFRSSIASEANQRVAMLFDTQRRQEFSSCTIIVDEHQDLIPDEWHVLFELSNNHPANSQLLFLGDTHQRVSNILFSAALFSSFAREKSPNGDMDIRYISPSNFRIHRKMAMFADCFHPRDPSDRVEATLQYEDWPNATQEEPITFLCVDNPQATFKRLFESIDDQVTVFSPHTNLNLNGKGSFEKTIVYRDWMSLKGLEFNSIVYIDPFPEEIPKGEQKGKQQDFKAIKRAQLYMSFTRARKKALIIISKAKRIKLEKYLNYKKSKLPIINKKNEIYKQEIARLYSFTERESDISAKDWCDKNDITDTIKQFQSLWSDFLQKEDSLMLENLRKKLRIILLSSEDIGYLRWQRYHSTIVEYVAKAHQKHKSLNISDTCIKAMTTSNKSILLHYLEQHEAKHWLLKKDDLNNAENQLIKDFRMQQNLEYDLAISDDDIKEHLWLAPILDQSIPYAEISLYQNWHTRYAPIFLEQLTTLLEDSHDQNTEN